MTTDPAERRHIVRGAIECAIRLAPGTRDRQTGPLTTTVWRVVEPALAQRDAQLDAVREVVAAMGGVTGAGFWAEQLRAALRPQPPAAATPQPPLTWCGASMPGVGGEPIGPCVLRHGHDGPVHQASTGARWWLADGGTITLPQTLSEQESEAFRAAWNRQQQRGDKVPVDAVVPLGPVRDEGFRPPEGLYDRMIELFGGPLPEDPPRLCPCGAQRFAGRIVHNADCPWKNDPGPLRAVAEQALGEHCRAEFHHPTMQSARCDLPAGHTELHREQPDPQRAAFRWDEQTAMHPTSDTTWEQP